ncbi:MAG TPA: SpoIID/LytB domain-containing protein [Gaiellaceae bacterium]|nr:SpoIID/LytB domain-containing protein [Gaiellaceae bacterium]
MGRFALRLAAATLLLLGGLASSILAAEPSAGVASLEPTTAVSTVSSTPATTGSTLTSPARSVLVVSGHGWGHGLGLSQWGAYGYAKHGWSYGRILAHYYSGTTLGVARKATVRVLVASGKRATLSSTVPWTVTDATGQTAKLDPGPLVLTRVLTLGAQPALQPPFTFASTVPLAVGGVAYRGKIVASSDGKTLLVTDVLDLEQYLKGVVPMEMPPTWSPEALKAQAVAARSYALANLAPDRAYDLYGDTRSQGYGGVAAETSSTNAAVDATTGQVVLYSGKVADTLYFSSSGGRTASALEATGIAVPYLVSVSDPYDTLAPYHDWGPVLLDATKVAKTLKLSAPIADVQVADGASGRVSAVTVVSSDDSQVTLTGNQVRGALGLRSTWFTPTLLQLLPASKTMTYGGAVSLTGVARGVDSLSLESKTAALPDWTPAGDLVLGPDGSFATIVQPQATTQYRLAWGDVRAGLAKIAVAPRVDATETAAGIQGAIAPVIAGATVYLQQQSGTTWTTLSATATDGSGSWSFAGVLAPGSYRIRCAPGQGLAAGVSPTLLAQ